MTMNDVKKQCPIRMAGLYGRADFKMTQKCHEYTVCLEGLCALWSPEHNRCGLRQPLEMKFTFDE